ncbi:MAG: CHAT domain-containing protein, partial [Okeania sp. SIO2G4]
PYQWANIQKNLGIAYLNRFTGKKSKNIELAITAYQQALTEITPIDHLLDWVIISINLGTAYLHRDTAEIIENIELSIAVYQQVLQVINPEKFALWWGIIHKNLGDAYSYQVRENIENITDFYQNIELAITAYQQALNIFTVENFPLECLQIYRKLGDLGFQKENWLLAIESYQVAIKLLEITQSLANTEVSYQEMLAESIYMYGNIVECYVKIEEYEQALEYVEASRSRRLVELMMINDIDKNEEKPAEVEEYYDLQQQINQLNFDTTRINKPITVGSQFSIKEIKLENQEKISLLKEKQQKNWQKIWSSDRVLAEQLQVTYLTFSDIQQLVKDGQTAIIDFYSTRNNTYIFLLTQQQLTVHICQGEGVDKLQTWIHDNWLKLHTENSSEWQNQMEAFLSELSEKLELNQIIEQLNEIKELIIIPHLYLHQIPYAALPVTREKETKYLCDYFRLRILPSCQILNYCSERTLINNSRKIGIVETPITNKFYTRYECETLANMYLISPQKRLQYSQAKINNYHNFIQQVQVLHSSHISQVNLVNPLASKLKLFDGDIVLSKVFAWRLPELFDVFLSSCEINLNQTKISDDILTFASAFISAGARHVISSLWLVEDLATALFCIFYYQHRQKNNRSEAFKKAQNQLRYLTGTQLSSYKKQLEGYLEQYMKHENSDKIQQKKELLSWFCQQSLPFTHPYYWAGFISQGIS